MTPKIYVKEPNVNEINRIRGAFDEGSLFIFYFIILFSIWFGFRSFYLFLYIIAHNLLFII
jgi:hypothetical protein